MSTPRALVIDDEPDIRQLLGMTLRQLGVEVAEAPDLTAAYLKLEKNHFDLCLTDMRLPDGNGLELIQHIQDKYPDLPVAMITAYGNTEIAVEALKLGAFDFVSKPVQLPKLRAMLAAALKLTAEPRSEPKAPGAFVSRASSLSGAAMRTLGVSSTADRLPLELDTVLLPSSGASMQKDCRGGKVA